MSLREFNTLSYPQNIDALLNYVIVNKSISNVYKSNIKMYETDFNIETTDNLKYEVLYNTLYVSTDGYGQAKLKLTNPVSKDDVFIIRFKIKYPKKVQPAVQISQLITLPMPYHVLIGNILITIILLNMFCQVIKT